MKKIYVSFIAIFLITATKVQAQEIKYARYYPMQVTIPTPKEDPWINMQREMEENQRMFEERSRAMDYNTEVISTEVVSTKAINLSDNKLYPVQINVSERRNGIIFMTCIGIKQYNSWNSCNATVSNLKDVYDKANSKDKPAILSMMEIANYLMVIDNKIYLLGGK